MKKLKGSSEYSGNKETSRKQLLDLLGDLPDSSHKISATKIAEEDCEDYILEKLVLDLNGIEPVPAHFVRPKDKNVRRPAILYNHAHGGDYDIGKKELTKGRRGLQEPPYAVELTRQGYSAMCIDTWAFGERRGLSEGNLFRHMLLHGRVMWGMMVYDNLRAIDYLVSRPDVAQERLGTMGISMGSTAAWWLAALDERIKVCVDICCLTDYQALIDTRGLEYHSIYYFVPSLLKHFTTAQINALIAPRAHLSLAGNFDLLTPPLGLDRIDKELQRVYEAEKAADKWKLLRSNTGHFETEVMRKEIMNFFERWL